MTEQFVAILFAVAVPAIYALVRFRVPRSVPIRWALGAAVFGLAVLASPLDGVDPETLERLKVLAAIGATAVCAIRAAGVLDARAYTAGLVGAVVLSTTLYFNFFAFHGRHEAAHFHDVAHYYLGAKYFPEIDYGELYLAMLQAEGEEFRGTWVNGRVRDLETGGVVSVPDLLSRTDSVRGRFGEERWSSFRKDVRFFRSHMGRSYGTIQEDHGYNPTPAWTLFGALIANRVSAGSGVAIRGLAAIDAVLAAVTIGAVAWAFGANGALLAVLYCTVVFGAAYSWTGGGFLRLLWLSTFVGSLCLLRKERYGWAGALLGISAMVRVFPALLALGLVARAGTETLRHRSVPPWAIRFGAGVCGACGIVFAATLAVYGIDAWIGFFENIEAHSRGASKNVIGLTTWFALAAGADVTSAGGFDHFVSLRDSAQHVQHWVLLPLTFGWIVYRARSLADPVSLIAISSLPVLVSLNLSAYYTVFLVVLVLAKLDRPRELTLVFGVELLVHLLGIYEPNGGVVFLYRSLFLVELLILLEIEGAGEGRETDPRSTNAPVVSS